MALKLMAMSGLKLIALTSVMFLSFTVAASVVGLTGIAEQPAAEPATAALALLAVAYVILYFTFGHFIAWQSPAVREYYGGTDPGSFFAQMRTTLRDRFWLLPFQFLRGLMWILLALPVIRMLRAQRWETALAVGLLFAVVMNAQLLLPNPFMPEEVRMMHLVETATSNFIFGGLVGWMLSATGGEAVELATSRA